MVKEKLKGRRTTIVELLLTFRDLLFLILHASMFSLFATFRDLLINIILLTLRGFRAVQSISPVFAILVLLNFLGVLAYGGGGVRYATHAVWVIGGNQYSGNSYTIGSGTDTVTLQYYSISPSVYVAVPTYAPYGSFGISAVAGNGACVPANSTFRLYFDETVPQNGSDFIEGTLSGCANQGSTSIQINWNVKTTATIGVVNYNVSPGSISDFLLPPNQGSLQGQITGQTANMSGRVFEDVNYGGGPGRSYTTSGGVGVNGARVELYAVSDGSFLEATTTDSAGNYQFTNNVLGDYYVRVVNSTVASTRPSNPNNNSNAPLIPVQTYRVEAPTGTPVAVTNEVGGRSPASVDAGSNTSNANFSALGVVQSYSPVRVVSGGVSGIDFGFNFDTIVNTNDSGQGSLRQFIINANALSNSGLAQAGLPPGTETSIFMIPTALLSSGVAKIVLYSDLPYLAEAVRIDGSTQTANVGNTNPCTVSFPGATGRLGYNVAPIPCPEVEVSGATWSSPGYVTDNFILAGQGIGGPVNVSGIEIKGLALWGFFYGVGHTSSATVSVSDCFLNMTATGAPPPLPNLYGSRLTVTRVNFTHNYINTTMNSAYGGTGGPGIYYNYGSLYNNPHVIRDNYFKALGSFSSSQLTFGAAFSQIVHNYFEPNGALAIDGGGFTERWEAPPYMTDVEENTFAGSATPAAIHLRGYNIYIKNNLFNGQINGDAIGLGGDDVADKYYVTQNDFTGSISGLYLNVLDSGGWTSGLGTPRLNQPGFCTVPDQNGTHYVNFPVIEGAWIYQGQLIIQGWTCQGSIVELIKVTGGGAGAYGGAPMLYLTTLPAEGSAQDEDSSVSSYGPGPVNGVNQGQDTVTRFRFRIPLPSGVSIGTLIAAVAQVTASDWFDTSERSPAIAVTDLPSRLQLSLSVSPSGQAPPGTDLQYQITGTNPGLRVVVSPTVSFPIPSNTDFKLNSVTTNVGSTGLTVAAIEYSSDGGATWSYTPQSGGGGAPAGYDRNVTHARVRFTGNFQPGAGQLQINIVTRIR